ncbi:hypothetical protein, partial [Anabaena sp. CCY 0017]|uniref:hypothetical protein n=1 Tax=Anabaena sp. CCY 0017 TaxID=3103866 RepID=UPI0039C74FDA
GGVILADNAAFADLVGADHEALIGGDLSKWLPERNQLGVGVLTQSALHLDEGRLVPVEVAVRRDGGEANTAPLMIYAV